MVTSNQTALVSALFVLSLSGWYFFPYIPIKSVKIIILRQNSDHFFISDCKLIQLKCVAMETHVKLTKT